MNEFFDLPLGFVYIQIGIAGVVLKDSIVAIILLVGLLGIVIAFALGSLSGGGE